MPERDVNLYIQDIKDSIRKIETYSKDLEYKDFKKDNKTQDAVIRNLEIIGEAASQIPKDFRIKTNIFPGVR